MPSGVCTFKTGILHRSPKVVDTFLQKMLIILVGLGASRNRHRYFDLSGYAVANPTAGCCKKCKPRNKGCLKT